MNHIAQLRPLRTAQTAPSAAPVRDNAGNVILAQDGMGQVLIDFNVNASVALMQLQVRGATILRTEYFWSEHARAIAKQLQDHFVERRLFTDLPYFNITWEAALELFEAFDAETGEIRRLRDLVIGTMVTVAGVKQLCEVRAFLLEDGRQRVRVSFLRPDTIDGMAVIGGIYDLALVKRVPALEPEAA